MGCAKRLPGGDVVRAYVPESPIPVDARRWFVRARMAEQRGDLEEAERAYRWVARLDASSPYSWLALGLFLESQGRYADGEDACLEAQRRSAQVRDVDLCLGRIRVRTGRDESARPRLEAAAAAGFPEAFAILARLELRAGDERSAAQVLDDWPHDNVGDYRSRRIDLALAVGDFDRAVDDLLILADERQPSDAERLVDAALHGCRSGAALAWFRSRGAVDWGDAWARTALKLSRNTGDVVLEGAALNALEETGPDWVDWLIRRERFELALALSEDLPELRGRALRGLGRDEEALRVWATVDNEGAAGLRVAAERVDLLLELGRAEAAMRAAEEAAANASDPKTTTWLRALSLAALGRRVESEDAIGRAWSGAQKYRRIARLRSETGADPVAVREALEAAVERGSLAALRELARLEERVGGDALSRWEQLLRREPDDVDAWVGIARLDDARRAEAVQKALAADPCDIGALMEAGGDLEACDALPLLDRAWDVAPTRASVREAREAARDACVESGATP